jgi:hypothetical protein
VTGFSSTYGGDDRYYQNIFVGGQTKDIVGTAPFDGYTTSLEEFIEAVDAKQPCDHAEFNATKQPVYISENVYVNGAKSFNREARKLDMPKFDAGFSIEEEEGRVYLYITMPDTFSSFTSASHNTQSLGRVRIVDLDFESFNGGPLALDSDYHDTEAGERSVSGPISSLKSGANRVCVW